MRMQINWLTLRRLFHLKGNIEQLQQDLYELPCPDRIRIGFKTYRVPTTVQELSDNICWGQRLFAMSPQKNDLESFLFLVSNYYQPIVTGKEHSEEAAVKFYRKITRCHVNELYPVAFRMANLFSDLVKNEHDKLSGNITKEMKAAEIEKLNVFADFNILKMVANELKVDIRQAHLIEYNIVFTLLLSEKESMDFNARYNEIITAKSK